MRSRGRIDWIASIALLILSPSCGSGSGSLPPAVGTSNRNCLTGAYRTTTDPRQSEASLCAGYRTCPLGFYCREGSLYPCPPGYFGNSTGLSASFCSGACPAGSYCPKASAQPTQCPPAFFCPPGSADPTPVSAGFYTDASRASQFKCPVGHYCSEGAKRRCGGGLFGGTEGLAHPNCSGTCPRGFFCPSGTGDYRQHGCGGTTTHYCPQGSERPLPVEQGHFAADFLGAEGGGFAAQLPCLPGSFCVRGEARPCPAGSFGGDQLESRAECAGRCAEGHFCPPGSRSPVANACGNASVFCPSGSGSPTPVLVGHFSWSSAFGESLTSTHIRSAQSLCPLGFYCEGGAKRACPGGRFGAATGLATSECSGLCGAGYYCSEGSVSSQAFKCDRSDAICPPGSALPRPVQPGYYSVDGYAETLCEPGYYCEAGRRTPCLGGRFGSEYGLLTAQCSGVCEEGYYCPAGSSSARELQCGGARLYCPVGSEAPMQVRLGHYSIGGDASTRAEERIAVRGSYAFGGVQNLCPAGTFGDSEGLAVESCSGKCAQGFFCPAGSTSAYAFKCGGDAYFCPLGSAAPVEVSEGFYSASYDTEECPPGRWRDLGAVALDYSRPGANTVLVLAAVAPCALCPVNTSKGVSGDDLELCRACPEWSTSSADGTQCECSEILIASDLTLHFNVSTNRCDGLTADQLAGLDDRAWLELRPSALTRHMQRECEAGYYCRGGVRSECPGGTAGAYPRETRAQCSGPCAAGHYCPPGSSSPYQNLCTDAAFFCPEGSAYPLRTTGGFSTSADGSAQEVCPAGFYCVDGVAVPCPAGTFSSAQGASSCDGICAPGYYCPTGSSSGTQFQCGSPSLFCPPGSAAPSAVQIGFYCDYGEIDYARRQFSDPSRKQCSVELPCEPGYYCSKGLKIACPPGTFSWRYGLKAEAECMLCGAGYYCPSTLQPQPGAPAHTRWPRLPQVTASAPDLECGGDAWFCPRGAAYPVAVSGGSYTVGGTNSTRWSQAVCPLGWFCAQGIAQPCANGRFGSSTGLSTEQCSGTCPPGFFCPEGSGLPSPCPDNHYSVSGAWLCSPCPGNSSPSCKTSRECCFADQLL